METNSKKLLEAIPDFRAFFELSEEIKVLYFEKMVIENNIRSLEAESFKEVMTNPKYFTNGKAPSVSYFENAFKHEGIDGKLASLRGKLADVVSQLDMKRTQYDIYKQMLDVWRTVSANERAVS